MADIIRWDPFRDLVSIQDELSRLFGRTYQGTEPMRPAATGSWMPALDIYETKERLVIELELPGIEPDDVELSVEDSVLTVKGARELADGRQQENYHRVERRYGQFARSITLPVTADAEQIQASFDKGVLRIEVPKMEEAKPRKIEIKAGL